MKEVFTELVREEIKNNTYKFLNKYKNIDITKKIKDDNEKKKYIKELSKLKSVFVEKAKMVLRKIKDSTLSLKNNIISGINNFIDKAINIVIKKNKSEVENLKKELLNIETQEQKEKGMILNETGNQLLVMYGEIFDIIMESVPGEEKQKVDLLFANIDRQKSKDISDFLQDEQSFTNGLLDV